MEPLTIIFQNRKAELTKSAFILFRYAYDFFRAEGQEEFEIAELSAVLTGRDSGKSKTAIGKLVRQIATALVNIGAPVSVICEREMLYVVAIDDNITS